MAVRLEFINLIIPIENIDQYYPGGFKTFFEQHKSSFGKVLWHDEYLFRDGAMNPLDMQDMVNYWQDRGLTPFEEIDGQNYWKDMCVVEFCGGPTLPCDWLQQDEDGASVHLRSKPRGLIIGREEMQAVLCDKMENADRLNVLFENQQIRLNRGKLFDQTVTPKAPHFDFKRIEGMLLGIAIGDALGRPTEGMLPSRRRSQFGEIRDYMPSRHASGAVGLPSDDTQLAFWTLEQLISDKKFVPEHVATRFVDGGRVFGIGKTVRRFLANYKSGKPWYESGPESAGNGALMRIAPILIPHLKTAGKDIWVDTALAAMMTHNDYSSTSACLAFVVMLWELLDMQEPPDDQWWMERFVELSKDLEGETNYSPRGGIFSSYSGPLWRFVQERLTWAYSQNLSVVDAGYGWYSGAYLLETVPSVLYILMRYAHNPEEAIMRAVNDTKDNDTIAAIVGAAVGALHGKSAFSGRWIKYLSGKTSDNDDGRIFELINEARDVFWDHSKAQQPVSPER